MSLKKILLLFIFAGLQLKIHSQVFEILSDNVSGSKIRIGLAADFSVNATAITATFLSKFYQGGYIDSNLKGKVLARTKNKNLLGADVNYGTYVGLKLDSIFHMKEVNLFFSLRDRTHMDALYSKDFYAVGFYGNASYAGRVADFNNFNLNFIRYQQFQIGLFSSQHNNAPRFAIAVSILKGEQYLSILARKAELFTAEDGQYIDFNTSMQVAQSNINNKGIRAFNGLGASVDIYFEGPFKTRFGDAKIKLSVSDIGSIKFNNRSLYVTQDSLFHYTGFYINSIYDLQNSAFATTSRDTITNNIAPFKKKSFAVTLPSTLNISHETQLYKNMQLIEGISYVFNSNYRLLVYLKSNFMITNKITISTTFGHGGYGGFAVGLAAVANFGNGFTIYAGSNNIEGFIAPQKTAGMAGHVSLIKRFN